MEIEEFCRKLPKIELHAHLNGSLSAETLHKLGCLKENIEEYQQLFKLMNTTNKTLEECFALFKVAQSATSSKEKVYLATKYVIEDFCNDNVVYLELRTTPREETHMTKTDYIESVVKAIEDCSKKIIVKLLLSIDRQQSIKTSEESMDVIINMKQVYPDIIKGVDFSGNPYVGSFNKNLFKRAAENGLSITLHCAEIQNANEAKQLLTFGPDRIGHGTFLHPNYGGTHEIWDLYTSQAIPLECCLTSNIICGTVASYKDHHLKEWIKNSLPFTISTDDKGVFGSNLSQEFITAAHHFKLTPTELWDISFSSVNYSFGSDTEKQQLARILLEWKIKNHF